MPNKDNMGYRESSDLRDPRVPLWKGFRQVIGAIVGWITEGILFSPAPQAWLLEGGLTVNLAVSALPELSCWVQGVRERGLGRLGIDNSSSLQEPCSQGSRAF